MSELAQSVDAQLRGSTQLHIIDPLRSVVAIVATYQPDRDVGLRITALASQVREVALVVDDATEAKLSVIGALPLNVKVVSLRRNLGIGAALNTGVRAMQKRRGDFVLFFDDDSEPDSCFVIRMTTALCRSGFDLNRVLAGPAIVNIGMASRLPAHGSRKWRKNLIATREFDRKVGVISSGTILSRVLFDELGGWNESLFIDGVDYDLCMRASSSGAEVVQLQQVYLLHQLGAVRFHRILGMSFSPTGHSALRRRYMFRNTTRLAFAHFWSEPRYAAGVVITQIRTLAGIVFFEKQKIRKLRYAVHGWLDALLARTGKIDA